jgi:hypothetical protein
MKGNTRQGHRIRPRLTQRKLNGNRHLHAHFTDLCLSRLSNPTRQTLRFIAFTSSKCSLKL